MTIRSPHALRTAALIGVAAAALSALAGCSSLSGDAHWADAAAMRASDQADEVPTLVADDATDIDLHESGFGDAGTQLRWRSATGIVRTDCRRGALGDAGAPDARWWPADRPDRGWACGWWRVFEQDGFYYARQDREAMRDS